jgi:trimeric autotransporter adhesin
MKKITLLLLTVASILLSNAQTTSTSNVLGTTGITAINSTTNAAFKLSINGTQKNYGTGDGTGLAATMVISPTIFLQNTTATTGKMYSINANNAGLFRISEAVGTTTFTATDRFVIAPTTGFIGMGNSAPTARLHITSSGITSATNALFVNNSANTNLLTVRDDGNVGIGIAAPTSQLHTTGSVKFAGLTLNTAAPRVLVSDATGLLSYRDATSFIADGSETKLTAGANVSVLGAGTTVSPYVIAATVPVNTAWDLNGNANATATSFLGTTTAGVDLVFKSHNIFAGIATNPEANTSFGINAYTQTSTGTYNTAFGKNCLWKNTTGINNTSIGALTMYYNTTGNDNTALARGALSSNTTGSYNTATGVSSLAYNISGSYNTASGRLALLGNTIGNYNTAVGVNSLIANTIGEYNTAIGSLSNVSVNNLTNATAIGANAYVSQSNSLILGSITGVNSAIASTNVGIGTTAPSAQLHTTSTVKFAGLTANTTPARVVVSDIDGNIAYKDAATFGSTADGSETKVNAGANVTVSGTGTIASPYIVSATVPAIPTALWTASSIGVNNITNANTGAVVIGSTITSLPNGYKLYVADGILAEKVKVALKSGVNWADYVFAKNYKLMPLSEVEVFVNKNKHLPGVQSAEELIKDGGIDVNLMFAKQMEKIEELTLYIIEQNKKIEALEKAVKKINK